MIWTKSPNYKTGRNIKYRLVQPLYFADEWTETQEGGRFTRYWVTDIRQKQSLPDFHPLFSLSCQYFALLTYVVVIFTRTNIYHMLYIVSLHILPHRILTIILNEMTLFYYPDLTDERSKPGFPKVPPPVMVRARIWTQEAWFLSYVYFKFTPCS